MIPVVGPVAPVAPEGPDEPEGEGLGLVDPVEPVGDGVGLVVGPVAPVGEGLGLVVGPVAPDAPVGEGVGLVVAPVAPVAPVTDASESGTFPPSETISERRTTIDADLSGRNLRPRRRGRPGKLISPIPSFASVAPSSPAAMPTLECGLGGVPQPGCPPPGPRRGRYGCPPGHVVAIRRGRPKVSKYRPT
jgi:hypothetical protein